MAIDRFEIRRRVKSYTAWAAGGAAVLTTAFAFGAARDTHKAAAAAATQPAQPQLQDDAEGVLPQVQQQDQGQGFAAPQASTAPPSSMSGGS